MFESKRENQCAQLSMSPILRAPLGTPLTKPVEVKIYVISPDNKESLHWPFKSEVGECLVPLRGDFYLNNSRLSEKTLERLGIRLHSENHSDFFGYSYRSLIALPECLGHGLIGASAVQFIGTGIDRYREPRKWRDQIHRVKQVEISNAYDGKEGIFLDVRQDAHIATPIGGCMANGTSIARDEILRSNGAVMCSAITASVNLFNNKRFTSKNLPENEATPKVAVEVRVHRGETLRLCALYKDGNFQNGPNQEIVELISNSETYLKNFCMNMRVNLDAAFNANFALVARQDAWSNLGINGEIFDSANFSEMSNKYQFYNLCLKWIGVSLYTSAAFPDGRAWFLDEGYKLLLNLNHMPYAKERDAWLREGRARPLAEKLALEYCRSRIHHNQSGCSFEQLISMNRI